MAPKIAMTQRKRWTSATPARISPPRRIRAPSTPQNSTRCWYSGGMAKLWRAARTRRGCRPRGTSPAGSRRRTPGPPRRRTASRARRRTPARARSRRRSSRSPRGSAPRGRAARRGRDPGRAAPARRRGSPPTARASRCSPLRRRRAVDSRALTPTARSGAALLAEDEAHRDVELETFAEPVHQEPPVGLVHGLRPVALDGDADRPDSDLHRVGETHRVSVPEGSGMLVLRALHPVVQLGRLEARRRLVVQLGGEVEDALHARPFQRADEQERGVADVLQVPGGFLAQPLRLAFLVAHQVPLVHRQDHRAAALLRLRRDPRVLLDAELRGVREHHHHVGALHRAERALGAEHLHFVGHLPLLAQTRGVHQDEGAPSVTGRLLHGRSEEHTSELQSRSELVCRLLLEKKKKKILLFLSLKIKNTYNKKN